MTSPDQTQQRIHLHPCAAHAVSEMLLDKVLRGGQGASGPVHARRTASTVVANCDYCSEPIRIGDPIILLTIKAE